MLLFNAGYNCIMAVVSLLLMMMMMTKMVKMSDDASFLSSVTRSRLRDDGEIYLLV